MMKAFILTKAEVHNAADKDHLVLALQTRQVMLVVQQKSL